MPQHYHALVRGASFRSPEEKDVARSLTHGDTVELRPEPSNPYDANAIMVFFQGYHIGYVGKEWAAYIQPDIIDAPPGSYTAEVASFEGELAPVLTIKTGLPVEDDSESTGASA